jgi:hypothetical protein
MKFLIASALIAAAVSAVAAPKPVTNSAIVPYASFPRVLTYINNYGISATGEIFVCPEPRVAKDGLCQDSKGVSVWTEAARAVPGYKLKGYELRFAGYAGNQILILYFGK